MEEYSTQLSLFSRRGGGGLLLRRKQILYLFSLCLSWLYTHRPQLGLKPEASPGRSDPETVQNDAVQGLMSASRRAQSAVPSAVAPPPAYTAPTWAGSHLDVCCRDKDSLWRLSSGKPTCHRIEALYICLRFGVIVLLMCGTKKAAGLIKRAAKYVQRDRQLSLISQSDHKENHSDSQR